MIRLSQFVGKHVVCKLKSGDTLIGLVQTRQSWAKSEDYHYEVGGHVYSLWGTGYSKEDIVSIEMIEPEHQFTGLAQKAPNINLDLFADQTVLVKFRNGWEHIGKLHGLYYLANIDSVFCRDGTTKCLNKDWSIHEIYGEGAYKIVTKPTFDEPIDPKVEEAKKLLDQMTEEQVAKLLKSLNE